MGICGTSLIEGPGHLLTVLLPIPFNYLSWPKARIEKCNADGVSKLQKYFPSTNLSEGLRILQTKYFIIFLLEVKEFNFKDFSDAKTLRNL